MAISGQITRCKNVDPCGLSFNFSPDFGTLGVDLSCEDVDLGTLGVDLGPQDSDDGLAGYLTDFLNSSMNEPWGPVRGCSELDRAHR